jgi:hypothetical protein
MNSIHFDTIKSIALISLVISAGAIAVPYEGGTGQYPERLRREDSFLGIHFDFHAGPDDKQIGSNVTPEMVEQVIQKVRPDYIQIDCKGHGGYSSYPTHVGNHADSFAKDPLRIWREVTAKHGVALYMHYSGVWDTKAVQEHPEWAVVKPDGQRDKDKTSVFGPYVDELLIPQLKELRNEYGVDGYWIDGECWATVPDYNPDVIEAFTQETGITEIPKGPEDPYWYEWTQFHREGFRAYCRHYTDILHNALPGVQVASNWAFSSMMPEKVSIDFDFLSGDYTLQDSVRDARWQSRCLRNQGMPWDLMAWGFSCDWSDLNSRSAKTAEQLKREAALVLATGGGFQCYYGQRRDASVRLWQMDVMGEVARFCRERQKFCHRSESVPQVALFYSTEALYREPEALFHPGQGDKWIPIRGLLNALLDGQQHVDVVMEHQLQGNCEKYPVIVFPEWTYVEPAIHKELVDYVRNGGNLLVVGAQSAELFKESLGLTTLGSAKKQIRWLHYDGSGAGLHTEMAQASFEPDVKVMGLLVEDDYPPAGGWPAGSIRQLGKGKIAGIYTRLGGTYQTRTTTVLRDYLAAMMEQLLPKPMVRVSGSHRVDVVLNRISIDGQSRLAINLVNMAGPHRDDDVYTFDSIPAVGPLNVQVRLAHKPNRILRQPGGEHMTFTYRDGVARFEVPRVNIHDIYVIDENE